jgi:hypothetical protein
LKYARSFRTEMFFLKHTGLLAIWMKFRVRVRVRVRLRVRGRED